MLEKPFWHLVINNAIVPCEKPLWSPRPAVAGTHPAELQPWMWQQNLGRAAWKWAYFGTSAQSPREMVTGNISQTIKAVRDHCTSLPRVPLQHRHWDVHCSLASWHSSPVAQFIVFLACCWQISEGGFPADFTLDNAWPGRAGSSEENQPEIWHKMWLSLTSENNLGAVKAEQGAQPIPILNTLGFALKLQLPPI